MAMGFTLKEWNVYRRGSDLAKRIAPGYTSGDFKEIGKICKFAHTLYIFAYVFAVFAASPSPIMDSTNGGPAAEGRRPTVVEAAEGCLHYGGWGGGKHSKNIWK